MVSIAILVGNAEYKILKQLDCCHDDVVAMKELLAATGKYDEITTVENTDADALKSQIRSAIDKIKNPEELFFYFTGHGFIHESEFFHCASNFDSHRPNETGLSTTELHTLLRLSDANLVVKVIDACYAGTLLIKSDLGLVQLNKDGFKNLIQIASSLNSQNSLTGNPLSVFTATFREAALRKTEGAVFYTDIISTLRDEFIDNSSQTPFFVSQHTGREQFVDDAKRLDALRKTIAEAHTAAVRQIEGSVTRPMTLLDRLRAADAKVVTPDIMATFVGDFLDNLVESVATSEFAEFFAVEHTEHASFEEPTTQRFIISVLSSEKRADNFVTAQHLRKPKNPMLGNLSFYLGNDTYDETWDLQLNCVMARAQLKTAFTPKFMNLQRVVLVVTCAPSLDYCYIFETATQHLLQDFGKFNPSGPEASRRWWKLDWRQSTDGVVQQISDKFAEIVRAQLESAEKRLAQS